MIYKDLEINNNIILGIIGGMLLGIALGCDGAITPILLKDLSNTWRGFITSTNVVAVFVIAPYLPKISSYLSYRKLMGLAVLSRAIALLSIYFFQFKISWLISFFLLGTGKIIASTSLFYLVNVLALKSIRGRLIGCLNASMISGSTIGTLLIAELLEYDLLIRFLIDIFLGLILFFTVYKITLPSFSKNENNISLIRFIRSEVKILSGGFLSEFVFYALYNSLVIYCIMNGFPEKVSLWYLSLLSMSCIFTEIPAGIMADKTDRHKLNLIAPLVVFTVIAFLPYLINSKISIFIIFLITTLMMGNLYTSTIASLGDKYQDKELVSANAAFSICNKMGAVCGLMCSSLLLDWFGANGMIIAIMSGCLVYFIAHYYIKISYI